MDFSASQMRSAKGGLASLLAGEGLIVEHRPGLETAMFDVEDRILMLPAWTDLDESVYDMLIGHEVGHALYTPSGKKALFTAIETIEPQKEYQHIAKQYLNIVEDARIERLIKEKYPGLNKDFFKAYKIIYNNNLFGDVKMLEDPNTVLPFIDKINLYYKVGFFVKNICTFSSQEEIDLNDAVGKTISFEDVIELTKKIYLRDKQAAMTAKGESDNKKDGDSNSNEGSEDPNVVETVQVNIKKGKNPNSDSPNFGGNQKYSKNMQADIYLDDEPKESNNQNSPNISIPIPFTKQESSPPKLDNGSKSNPQIIINDETEGELQRRQRKTKDQTGKVIQSTDTGNGSQSKNNAPSESITQKNLTDSISKIEKLKSGETRVIYKDLAATSEIPIEEIVVPFNVLMKEFDTLKYNEAYLQSLIVNFKTKNKLYIQQLSQEFDRKKAADSQRRTTLAKTGILNMGKLFSYKYNEDIFKKNTIVKDGKNHGMIMVIDWSGSMSSCIADTLMQMLTLVEFCKAIKIPFEVYAFSDVHLNQNVKDSKLKYHGMNKVMPVNMSMIQFMSDKMKSHEYSKMLSYLLHYCNIHKQQIEIPEFSNRNIPGMLSMGGTPLNSSIIAATCIIKDFKQRTKTQIVNFMILTDGDNTDDSFGKFNAKDILVLRDRESRNQISANVGNYINGSNCSTILLLDMLKRKCDCNTMGFYLVPSCYANDMIAKYCNHGPGNSIFDTLKKCFDKNKYCDINNAGYDSYFIVPSDNIELKEDGKLSGKNVDEIAASFAKNLSSRKTNKIFLSRLADVISGTINPKIEKKNPGGA